jgi:hypothetical protein
MRARGSGTPEAHVLLAPTPGSSNVGTGVLLLLVGPVLLLRGFAILRNPRVRPTDPFETFLNWVLRLENVVEGRRAVWIGTCHILGGTISILMGIYALLGGQFER